MAFNSFAANAFARNFMTGFSFVDEIKRSKRNEQRLEERLAQEKEERAFQRRRTIERDKQVREDRAFTASERERVANERQQREAGVRASLNPDSTDEELAALAPNSPEAAAELKRRIGEERFQEALRGAQTIPTFGQTGAAALPGGGQPGSLSDVVTQSPGDQQQGAPQDNLETAQQNTLEAGPDRGVSGLQEISEEEFNTFNEEFQEKGFVGKVTDVVGGQFAQTFRSLGDVVQAGANIRAPFDTPGRETLPQNVGNEFTGTINVPADEWTDAEEFAALEAAGDNAGIKAASDRNKAITQKLIADGRRASGFLLGPPASRQGAALEGSDAARNAAIREQNAVVANAEQFLDPTVDSQLEQLAMTDPRAAAVQYMRDRATLHGARPDLGVRVDQRMQPILDAAEASIITEISQQGSDSRLGRQNQAALSNLQTSQNQIASSQPSVREQSGVRPVGLKVGDQPRVQQVADTIFDPNRVTPSFHTPAAINNAANMAERISPNRRLNERQIQSLATLAEAGWIDKPTAMSVMMTGAWPPGKNPNGIKKIQEAGDNVYAITEAGTVHLLQRGKAGKTGAEQPSREIGDEAFGWIEDGIRMSSPDISPGNLGSLKAIVAQDPGWFRTRFNINSQEDMRKLGLIMHQSLLLQGKKFTDLEDGWFTTGKDAPTTRAILTNPDLRDSLANEFDVEYIPMPDVKDTRGIDVEAIRQNMREGRFGPTAAENVDQYNDDQVLQAFARWETMRRDNEAATGAQ